MNTKRQRSGQMGGIATKMRYGTNHFVKAGKRGGRPRRQQPILEDTNEQRRLATDGFLPNSLKGLKELWKLQNNKGAGIAGG